MTKTTLRRSALAALALGIALPLGACGSGNDSGGSSGDSVSMNEQPGSAVQDEAAGGSGADRGAPQTQDGDPDASDVGGAPVLISTASVSLQSKDVAKTRQEVVAVVDQFRGTRTEETTGADEGVITNARLVIRVPADKFTEAVDQLEGIASLDSSTIGTEDVTTEVIDVDARVRAQERGLQRVEALLADAKTLEQVIAIEGQISQRQADLESLKARQKWLADQTAQSTITVQIFERDTTGGPEDETGFGNGLAQGWDSFVAGVGVALTLLGFLLPWLVALAVLFGPLAWGIRRVLARRRSESSRPTPTPTPAAGPDAPADATP